MICRKYSLQKLTRFWKGNNILHAPLLTEMVSFGVIHVFLQLRWRGHFGIKWAFLHLENYDFQEVFLSKTNTILTGKMCLMLMFLTQMFFFWTIHVFLHLSKEGLFGANRAYLHHETLKLQEVFLSKPKSILTGNNMLDAAAANIHDFLWRDIYVSSTQLNRRLWIKQSLSPTWNS
jgi:hypothetical protein